MKVSIFLTILMLAAPVVLAQVKQENPEQERAATLRDLQQRDAALPRMTADSIEQVVKFGVENDFLSARTAIKTENQVSVKAPGLQGFVWVQLMGAQGGSESAGRNFQFLQFDMSDPKIDSNTSVAAIGGRLILSRDGESEQLVTSVQLIEDPPAPPGAAPADEPVRLLVHIWQPKTQVTDVDLKLSARSFTELRRKNEREVNQYLRPILRDFKQEAAVFAVPSPIAWQVLGGQFQPDPQLKQRVQAIVTRLNAENFRDRESAMEELKGLGQPAAIVLGKLDRSKLSLQQNSGIETFLSEFAPLPPGQSQQLADNKGFLLDVLYNDDPALRELALAKLREVSGKPVQLDPALDAQARGDAIAKLRDELVSPTTQR